MSSYLLIKARLCKLLAFVLIINCLTTFIGTEVAKAALPLVITPSFTKTMTTGVDNMAPVLSYKPTDPDQVYMDWNLSDNLSDAVYRLSYYADDDKRVDMTVVRENTVLKVKYDVIQVHTGNTLTPSYYVHTNVNAGGKENFIPIDTFLSSGFNVSDPQYQVVDTAAGTSGAKRTPSFIVKADTGFSFMYDNRKVHFKWDSATKSFQLVTNGAYQGRIYNFSLASYEGLTLATLGGNLANLANYAPSTTVTQRVLTGISKKTFRSIPIANGGTTVSGQALDIDADLFPLGKVLILPDVDANPGSPRERGMILRFDVPLEYNAANNTFSLIPTGYKMPVRIDLKNVDPNEAFQISLDDILSATPTSTVSAGSYADVSSARVGGNRLSVKITSLKPGMLYDPVTISVVPDSSLIANDTKIPFGLVFTFMNYEVSNVNGVVQIVAQPFTKYAGEYLLFSGPGDPRDAYAKQKSDGINSVMLPISITQGGTMRYQLFYTISGYPFPDNNDVRNQDRSVDKPFFYMYSQIVEYTAPLNMAGVGVPQNFHVITDRTRLYPTQTKDVSTLEFTAQWDIGTRAQINNELAMGGGALSIDYKLNQSLVPSPTDTEPSLKEFTTMKLLMTSFASSTENPGNTYDAAGYGSARPPITSLVYNIKKGATDDQDVLTVAVTFKLDITSKNSALTNNYFYYPNIYFMNTKPLTKNGVDVSHVISGSLFSSLTINDLANAEVAPPQNITLTDPVIAVTPKNEVSLKLNYQLPVEGLSNYFNNTFQHPQSTVDFNMYVTQNSPDSAKGETYMRDIFSALPPDKRSTVSVPFVFDSTTGTRIYFSKLNSTDTPVTPAPGASYPDAITALRAGEIVNIKGLGLSPQDVAFLKTAGNVSGAAISPIFVLDGLDKNQKYYVYMDTVVTDTDVNGVVQTPAYSILSNLTAEITKSDKDLPTGSEKVPSAPVLDKDNIDLDRASILWNKIPKTDDKEVIEYEIIRIKDNLLTETDLNTRETYEKFWSGALAKYNDKAGFRTNGLALEQFTNNAFAAADQTLYTYNSSANPIVFTDKSLAPNQLYFYYVRTVRIINNQRIPSVWSAISVTTTPIKAPKNLVVERNRNDYDTKMEAVISFDAPITDINKLGTEFNLQYQLKEENGDWQAPVTMDIAKLKTAYSSTNDKDYLHFIYKISGLKPSTSYSVRVRMLGKNNDTSLYTNVGLIRTDMSQEDYDKDKETSDWIKYVQDLMKEQLKAPNWVMRDSGTEFETIYRASATNAMLAQATDGAIILAETKAAKATYYMPYSMMLAANEAKKGFKFVHNGIDIVIPPGTVNFDANQAVFNISNNLKRNEIADYYVKLTVTMSDYTQPVDGSTPLSQLATVAFELGGSTKNLTTWDNDMLKELSALVTSEAMNNAISASFSNLVKNKVFNEDILKYVNTVLENNKLDFGSRTTARLREVSKLTYPVTTLDNNVAVVGKGFDKAASVTGYQQNGNVWLVKEAADYGESKAIYTKTPGAYIFAGSIVKIQGLELMANAGTMTGIVAKYGLDDFFGKGTQFNLEANTSRFALVSTIVRMAGAQKGADAAAFLKQNKINISTANMNGDVMAQEAIHMVMMLYEARSGASLSSLRIRDFNTVNNIAGIDERYKASIRAAFELSIFDDTNLLPSGPIRVRDVLPMLERLDSKVPLK